MATTSKNFNKLTNLDLSIQISLSGLSFCTLQRDSNTITSLKYFDFNKKLNTLELLDKLQHIFNTEEELQDNFNNVSIIHDNELSTLVPKALFNEDCLADYLKFNSKILKSDFITFDNILINDSVNVYVPYININNFIYDKFGEFTFKHASTVLIEQILLIEKNSDKTKVYVNINKSNFEIVVVNNTSLIFYNTFEYKTKEDFIYYLLFTAEQLKLNPETLNLIFLGNIDTKDELYVIAYKYIRYVFLGNREDNYKYNIEAQPVSHFSNFTLIKSF
ncbi:DUF3822 family protein [Thalassobellus sediminis]|uniref:DUF3822 family protein n=1 Tax=Thalassobellus sediminis TaxID=3367753 RepID=UPI0037A2A866